MKKPLLKFSQAAVIYLELLFSHFLQSVAAGEVCTALLIEAHELDPGHVAQVQNVLTSITSSVEKSLSVLS